MKQNAFFSKQNRAVKVLLVLMAIWMLWFVGSAIVGQVRDTFVQSAELHYTTMEQVETGYGVVITTEHILNAALDGTAERVIAEGERVRKGNAVYRIGEEYQYTNFSGRVSYNIDGLENVSDIGIIANLDLKDCYNAQQKKNKQTNTAVLGEPYAKVQETMNGSSLYVVVPNTNKTAEIGIGQTVRVRFTEIDETVKGEIVEALNTDDGKRCMKLNVGLTNEVLFQHRVYQIELPYNSERVLVLPKQALIKRHGANGVYYLHKGFVFWKEVTVSDRWLDQDVFVVESGLEEGDIIVTTPRLVREGENIKF
jgi:hypothetical protein